MDQSQPRRTRAKKEETRRRIDTASANGLRVISPFSLWEKGRG
jgi:hypothetical protein